MISSDGGKLRVEVTQEDIDNGVIASPQNCPIALAVKRELTAQGYHYLGIIVGNMQVQVLYDAYCPVARYNLPVEAYNFILAFDNKGTVEPFTMELKRRR